MSKQALRERVWDDLEASGVARFPFPPHGRIPNFAGAAEAADRLAERPEFVDAQTIKCNPDAPQRPVRRRALEAGTTLFVAVPRLSEPECFLELIQGPLPGLPEPLHSLQAGSVQFGSSPQ